MAQYTQEPTSAAAPEAAGLPTALATSSSSPEPASGSCNTCARRGHQQSDACMHACASKLPGQLAGWLSFEVRPLGVHVPGTWDI